MVSSYLLLDPMSMYIENYKDIVRTVQKDLNLAGKWSVMSLLMLYVRCMLVSFLRSFLFIPLTGIMTKVLLLEE
jgi:hypothetical protein